MARFAEARSLPFKFIARNKKYASWALYATLFVLYNAYWIGCLIRYSTNGLELEWCDGLGFLTILTIIVYTGSSREI
jgi:pyrimidine nucleoside transport protein